MNLAAVMDDLASAVGAIVRVAPYWADRVNPPQAVVSWPESYDYDATMARGADRFQLPLTVLVGKVDQRTARDTLAAFANGSGERSIKAAVEAHTFTACDVATVKSCEFVVITVAGTEYLAGQFTVDIMGTGA